MKFDSEQISHNMLVQNMPSLAVAMVVAREKNIEKKSIFFKFHETSKYHIFRKLIFSSCFKMFIDFFKGLTDISKSWNLDRKIHNNHKSLCFEIQNNTKFQPFQKLQVLKTLVYHFIAVPMMYHMTILQKFSSVKNFDLWRGVNAWISSNLSKTGLFGVRQGGH